MEEMMRMNAETSSGRKNPYGCCITTLIITVIGFLFVGTGFKYISAYFYDDASARWVVLDIILIIASIAAMIYTTWQRKHGGVKLLATLLLICTVHLVISLILHDTVIPFFVLLGFAAVLGIRALKNTSSNASRRLSSTEMGKAVNPISPERAYFRDMIRDQLNNAKMNSFTNAASTMALSSEDSKPFENPARGKKNKR